MRMPIIIAAIAALAVTAARQGPAQIAAADPATDRGR